MVAHAENQQRQQIDRALGTLGIQLEIKNDHVQYSIKATSAIVYQIMKEAGTNFKNTDEDDIFTAGLFLFTVSGYITRVMGAPFEHVAYIAPLDLFSETHSPLEIAKYVDPIAKSYNNAIQTSKIINAIGQNIVDWINQPTDDQFMKIVELYKLCKENIRG